MKVIVKTTGFKDVDAALAKIEKKATQKAVMRRALKTAAQPMADAAKSKAPRDDGTLQASIGVSTKLSGRQKKLHRKLFRNDKAAVEMFVGAGPLSSAHNQEFGNEHHGPQPFMRPAWDQEGRKTLDRLGTEMWSEIEKQTKRTAKRDGWEV